LADNIQAVPFHVFISFTECMCTLLTMQLKLQSPRIADVFIQYILLDVVTLKAHAH